MEKEKTDASRGGYSVEDFAASNVHLHDIVPNKRSVIKIAKDQTFGTFAAGHRHFLRYDLISLISREKRAARKISVDGEELPRESTNRQFY